MRSNSYTIGFTAVVTIILGFILSVASISLKDRQNLNEQIDIKKNILRSLEISCEGLTQIEIKQLFERKIKTVQVNTLGDIDKEGSLTVFEKIENGNVLGYSIPVQGKGLWSTIYGYLAIEPDGETIMGITFYKHGETPGLGGEIEKDWFTGNFKGKKIVDSEGQFAGIHIIKGKVRKNDPSSQHKVDGISGATMTTRGVNKFLKQELNTYLPFFEKVRKGSSL